MYNAAQQQGQPNAGGQGGNATADAEVTDVDFEEVKDGK
jgi:hypothetical protein